MVRSHVSVSRGTRRFSRNERWPRGAGTGLLRQHWKLLLIAAVLGGVASGIFFVFLANNTARATLVGNTSSNSPTHSVAAALDLLRSPDVLREAGHRAQPPVSGELLGRHSRAEP